MSLSNSSQPNTPKHGAHRHGADDEAPIEPAVDPDSQERLAEEIVDPPHEATRFEAPNGQGTSDGTPYDREFLERPVLDGATMSPAAEASVPNPYRGQADPARITKQPALVSARTDRWLISSAIAGTILVALLLLLIRWNPFWCAFGVIFALGMLLAMLGVRLSRIPRRARLRIDAVLMALLWLVPLGIVISVVVGSAHEIWPF